RIGGRPDAGCRRLLEVLTAEFRALVDQNDVKTGLGGDGSRTEPSRTAADHKQLAMPHPFLRTHPGSRCSQSRQCGLADDTHSRAGSGHAGSLCRRAVDLDEAFLADAHPAEDAAAIALATLVEASFPGGDQRRGNRHALADWDLPTVEAEPGRLVHCAANS